MLEFRLWREPHLEAASLMPWIRQQNERWKLLSYRNLKENDERIDMWLKLFINYIQKLFIKDNKILESCILLLENYVIK